MPELVRYNFSTYTYNNVVRLCWDLIKGVAYLHRHLIAHRDIKPSNLVVDLKDGFCVKIIDCDCSMKLGVADELVPDYCGTEGWLAPEIESESPRPKYSPIKADRWACGKVISYFLDQAGIEHAPLRSVVNQLMIVEPERRPSLAECTEAQQQGVEAGFSSHSG